MRYLLAVLCALSPTSGLAQSYTVDWYKAPVPLVGLCSETTRTVRTASAGPGVRVEQVSEQTTSGACSIPGSTVRTGRGQGFTVLVEGAMQDLSR